MSLLAKALGALAGVQLIRFGLSVKYEPLYATAGARWGVDPEKLHALALQESHENPAAIGSVNADGSRDYGQMQINENNFARLGVTAQTVMDPATNINAAAHLLADMMTAAPQLDTAAQFSVYNAGWGRDPATGNLRARITSAGVYVNLRYVLESLGWYVLVVLARFAVIQRLP